MVSSRLDQIRNGSINRPDFPIKSVVMFIFELLIYDTKLFLFDVCLVFEAKNTEWTVPTAYAEKRIK